MTAFFPSCRTGQPKGLARPGEVAEKSRNQRDRRVQPGHFLPTSAAQRSRQGSASLVPQMTLVFTRVAATTYISPRRERR